MSPPNGSAAKSARQPPWLVAVYVGKQFVGSGTLIARGAALTANHVIERAREPLTVRGVDDQEVEYEAKAFVSASHPASDIAVLELKPFTRLDGSKGPSPTPSPLGVAVAIEVDDGTLERRQAALRRMQPVAEGVCRLSPQTPPTADPRTFSELDILTARGVIRDFGGRYGVREGMSGGPLVVWPEAGQPCCIAIARLGQDGEYLSLFSAIGPLAEQLEKYGPTWVDLFPPTPGDEQLVGRAVAQIILALASSPALEARLRAHLGMAKRATLEGFTYGLIESMARDVKGTSEAIAKKDDAGGIPAEVRLTVLDWTTIAAGLFNIVSLQVEGRSPASVEFALARAEARRPAVERRTVVRGGNRQNELVGEGAILLPDECKPLTAASVIETIEQGVRDRPEVMFASDPLESLELETMVGESLPHVPYRDGTIDWSDPGFAALKFFRARIIGYRSGGAHDVVLVYWYKLKEEVEGDKSRRNKGDA